MKPIILTTFLLSIAGLGHAQKISGSAKGDNGEPLIAGNVALLKAADSSAVKYTLTEENGSFLFEGIEKGSYIVKIEDYESAPIFSQAFEYDGSQDLQVPELQTKTKVEDIGDVVITYQRPMVEMKADRLVFNIDSTINSVGQNGLDLMRKSPGVLVDKDENITMNGKNGVRVYIDGRPSPLTGTELSEYLKTIQSNTIDAIEIISNPGAKYDAAGNAGIINIRLKKNKMVGTNGSVNLGYGIQVFSKYNGGISLNHRNGKMNVYGSYNINTGNWWNEAYFERNLGDSFFNQSVLSRSENTSHNYKAGVDYYINKKSTVGVMVNGVARNSMNYSNNNMDIIHSPTNTLTRRLIANNEDEGKRSNFNANANYQYLDNAAGKEFTFDLDYGIYDMRTSQYQPNVYYDQDGEYVNENVYKIVAPTQIEISSAKADYEQNFLKGKLGLGAKVSFINTQNDFQFNNRVGGSWVEDLMKTNDFNYNENIQAAYASYNRQFTGIALQAGLRLENTITKGTSIGNRMNGTGMEQYEEVFERNYLNFFPSLGITFNKNPMSQWGIAYSKRIDRPNYQDLNPFEFKMNDYAYRKGNIKLLPQITNSVSVSHTYKYMLNTKLEYAHVSNVFAELVDTIDGYKLFQTKANLATQDMISLNISAPYSYKNWSFFANVNAYYAMFQADYGNGRKIDLDVFSFNTYGQASYKVNSWLSAEVSGWYTAPSIWQGTFRSQAMGGIDVGAQARVLKGKGTFKVSMGDIFRTMEWGGSSDFVGQSVRAHGRWESQQLRLNFNYNFGNNKLKSRQRETSSEDEKSRAGESQGGMNQGGGK